MSDLLDGLHRATVAASPPDERLRFIRRTYLHLAAALAAFMGIEAVLCNSKIGHELLKTMFSFQEAWIVLMLVFVATGIAAQLLARSRSSTGLQYAGLAIYVLLEVAIFLPVLMIVELKFQGQHLPLQASILALSILTGLVVSAFRTKDFYFLGPVLWSLAFLALAFALNTLLFDFHWEVLVMAGALVLALGLIVHGTSRVLHHYSANQYVAACLELGSVAIVVSYIVQIIENLRDED